MIQKPVDYRRTHPLFTSDVETRVAELLHERLTKEQIDARMRTDSKGRLFLFNRYDFLSVVHKEGWKNSDKNEFCYRIPMRTSEQYVYSEEAVEYIVDKMILDPDYIERARDSYRSRS